MEWLWVYTSVPSFALSAVVALLTAYVTVRLALRRFRAEQWWSRKADAYAAIMEALHNAKDCDSVHFTEINEDRHYSPEYKAELSKRGREADQQIRKGIDTSTFLLSEEAVEVLEELRSGLAEADDAQDYAEHLWASLGAVNKCLEKLPSIAKKDLGVK